MYSILEFLRFCVTQHLDGRQQNCHVGSSRPLSLSRLPLRAQFYQKRDVWVRGRCGTQNADSVSGSLSIVCLFYVLLFSRNKILIRKEKKNIFGVLPTINYVN